MYEFYALYVLIGFGVALGTYDRSDPDSTRAFLGSWFSGMFWPIALGFYLGHHVSKI